MRGAAMSLTAAACGFVVFLLSAPVIQGKNDWGVTYPSHQICAFKGSKVEISCSYTYPTTKTPQTKINQRFWFTKSTPQGPVDLKTDSDYTGRVEYNFHDNDCTLRIKDLRESDAAEYKFSFITNEGFTGSPGVTLSVTDLQVQVERSSAQVVLRCHSKCNLSVRPSYVWYNRQKTFEGPSSIIVNNDDNIRYSCAVKGHEKQRSAIVYPPKRPSVSVSPSEIVEGSLVTLTCRSDANPPAKYTWYKKNGNPGLSQRKQTRLVFSPIQSSDSGEYYCTAKNSLKEAKSQPVSINVKYAPRLPSVSVSPSEIVEGSSVNLTCSSDANPAASYTWYKESQTLFQGSEGSYHFPSISSEDRGNYYCKSENQHGKINSSLFVNVQYAPRLPSVSVSPSEIVEGSSVTLTCSSDANPAANYTWYKENQTLFHGPEGRYRFPSISSEDSGIYYCKSENQHGKINSSLFVNVQFPPRLPSVSVSPSKIVEGSSVNLTCSSDANPAANYTWYKENEDSPKASGQIFSITDFRAEHSGNYYCEAQNSRGRRNSTLHLTVVAGAQTLVAAATVPAIFLAIIFISVFLLIMKKRSSKQVTEPEERPDDTTETLPAELQDQDGNHYASVHFSKKAAQPQERELHYATINFAKKPSRPRRIKVEESVVYASVKFNNAGPASRSQEAAEDPMELYSTVTKKRNP